MAEFVWNGEQLALLALQAGDRALARLAMTGVTIMKQRAPVDTGRYQRSLRTAPPDYDQDDTEDATTTDLAATSIEEVVRQMQEHGLMLGSWILYAYFLERGTSRMIAQPTVQPALDALLGSGLFEDYFDTEIARVVE